LNAPPPEFHYDRADSTSLEVYRVFCRRVAKEAYPKDDVGLRFYEECDSGNPEDEPAQNLRMMLKYRDEILSSFKRGFAEESQPTDGVMSFEDGELSGFLRALVPLYDLPQETIPTTTRGIADVLEQLIDPTNERAVKVLDTVARLVKRLGYRTPELNIGAVRAILTYPELETLATKLLPVLSTTLDEKGHKAPGAARGEFIALLNALALELADDPVMTDRADSTLRHVLELALAEDDKQSTGKVGTTLVLQRDGNTGDALGDPNAGTPFPVAGRADDAADRDRNGLALSDGKPAYETVDVSKTLVASIMRETSVLISRTPNGEEKERAPLESFAHGVRPLLGPWGARTLQIGQNNYAFQGPDIDKSALMQFMHSLTLLARYPETLTLIRTLDALLQKDESAATAVVYAAMNINDASKDDQYKDAKLNGPHEFWDDLIAASLRMNRRPGLFEALIRSFTQPNAGAQGKLFATWMRYADEISYPNYPSTNRDDINKPVAQTYMNPVDRGQPDVGFNRSIWQRTMSMIASLNGQKVCNKTGGFIKATTNIGDLFFPAFNGQGYKECELVEIQDALEIYSQSVIGKAKIQIKDSFADLLAAFGSATGISGSVGEIQERESQITGFNSTPTPRSLARFIFAPRNEWVNNLFDPQMTNYGVPATDYEHNGLFPIEVVDDETPNDSGKASSFLELGVPLVQAFDDKELRMVTDPVSGATKLTDGYMFGNLLTVVHNHWSSRKSDPCPAQPDPMNPGCTQSLDRTQPFYSPQTGLVSYEELIAEALDKHDFVNVLAKAAKALVDVKVTSAVDGSQIDGVKALADFVQRLTTVDPTLKKFDGSTNTRTNLCVDDGNGGCKDGVGSVIPQLAPIHVFADALHAIDQVWENEKDRHDAWLQGRSDLVDALLTVEQNGGKYQLRDRTAYNIVHPVLTWVDQRITAHKDNLDAWAVGDANTQGLSERLAKIMRHPITAGVVDLLDAFWPEAEASGEFTKVVSYMTDEQNEASFRAMSTAIADSMNLLDKDPDLSPAIQFAALVLAPNVFQAIDGQTPPNADKSTAYAALELTGGVVTNLNDPKQNKFKKDRQPTALTKLLNNIVLATNDERSALEVLIDAAADVNRPDENADSLTSLSAEEDRDVFTDVKLFLRDDKSDQRSLERLYQVIQNRKVKK
jgi:hypothetical protein